MAAKYDDLLRYLRNGECLNEASDGLTDLVDAVRRTGKVGKISLELTLRPPKNRESCQITVEDRVVVKAPESPNEPTLMYVDDENGDLVRRDPNAREESPFEARDVEAGSSQVVSPVEPAAVPADARDVG